MDRKAGEERQEDGGSKKFTLIKKNTGQEPESQILGKSELSTGV